MGNYSATKTQRDKGNKNISILHSHLKKKNVLQEKVEQYYSIILGLGAFVARYLGSCQY